MWQPLCGVESTCDADDRFVELREHHLRVRLLRRPAALHRLPRTIARGFHLRASPKPRPRLLGSAARPHWSVLETLSIPCAAAAAAIGYPAGRTVARMRTSKAKHRVEDPNQHVLRQRFVGAAVRRKQQPLREVDAKALIARASRVLERMRQIPVAMGPHCAANCGTRRNGNHRGLGCLWARQPSTDNIGRSN